jgi:hypothetical protein
MDVEEDGKIMGTCEWHSLVNESFDDNSTHHLECISYSALLQQELGPNQPHEMNFDAFDSMMEEVYINGDSEIKLGLDFSKIASLRLRATGIMFARTIQKNKSGQPPKVIFDTGSDKTLFNLRALPKGTSPKTGKGQRVAGVHNTEILNQEVLLEDICFPEFSVTQRIPGPIKAVCFKNPESTYNVIIGMDLMQTLGIIVDCATNTISWNGNHVPFRPADYFKDPSGVFDIDVNLFNDFEFLFTDFESEDKVIEAASQGYKSKTILHSKYDKVDTDEVADQQTHLTAKQRDELKQLLKKYTKLFSGKLGQYPHRKIHLDVMPNAVPKTCRPYPVPKHQEQVFKT